MEYAEDVSEMDAVPDDSFDLGVEEEAICITTQPTAGGRATKKVTHQCKDCSYKSTRRYNIIRHRRLKHTTKESNASKDKMLVCEHCAKTFKTKSGLRLHVKNIHVKEFKHTCIQCNKGFNLTTQFKYHQARHIQFKVQECNFCHKQLDGHSSKQRHERTCQNNPERGEASFQCRICYKEFTSNDCLLDHKKGMHQERKYTCKKCHQSYKWRSSLSAHLKRCK